MNTESVGVNAYWADLDPRDEVHFFEDNRRFRVVWIRGARKGTMFPGPLTHDEACNCLKSVTSREGTNVMLEQIQPQYVVKQK